jgi:hypothetical protein
VDFPELGLFSIEAKIDTGAYTSAIHCRDVHHFEREGLDFVSFLLLDHTHPQYENQVITMPVLGTKQVKNSFGQTEERLAISTTIKIFNESYPVELSLTDRSAMDYPVLLGRKAIKKRFLVDVSKTNCSFRSASKKKAL